MADAPAPPPPPPGMPNAPPPPPGMVGSSVGSPMLGGSNGAPPPGMNKLRQVTPGVKLRPMHWNRVQTGRVVESVWGQADDLIMAINGSHLKKMFAVSSNLAKTTTSSASAKGSSLLIMDNDKARNIGIFLSSGKVDVKAIGSRLLDTDPATRLTIENLAALQKIQPSEEERKRSETIKSQANMQLVDVFMIELCKIENLSHFLYIQVKVQEFPLQLANIPPLIDVLIAAAKEVRLPSFKRLLEYLLAIGNYINSGTPRGNCYGFRMSSLSQVGAVKSSEKGYSVLNFLIDTVFPHERGLERLPKLMGNVREAAGLSMKDVVSEVQKVERSLDKVLSSVKEIMAGKPTLNQEMFCTKILKVAQSYRVELAKLTKQKDALVEEMKKMGAYLGESPTQDPSELFLHIATFLTELEQAYDKAIEDKKKEKAKLANAASMPKQNSNDSVSAASSAKPLSAPTSVTSYIAPRIQEKPTRSGWMDKLNTGVIVKCDTRWFELDDSGSLYYYKKAGSKALGSVYLRGLSLAQDSSNPGMITFTVEGRKWQLVCKTPEEAFLWLQDLRYYT